jgi:hypothetical protein
MKSLLILLLGLPITAVQADTYVVSQDGSGDYAAIAPAVAAAQDGDTVLIALGTYRGADNKNISFNGKRLVLKGVPGDRLPVIDCEQNGRAFSLDHEEPLGASIEALRIVNGSVIDSMVTVGGGIWVGSGTQCRLENIEIADCVAAGGGGISIWEGRVQVRNLRISGCYGWWDGGGIYASGERCTLLAEDILITGCEAIWGAGLRFAGDSLIATQLELRDNAASNDGGGLEVTHTDYCDLRDCVIQGNLADNGGGLFSQLVVELYVTTVQFRENFAGSAGGGAFFENINNLIVDRCIFDSDETQNYGRGGGAYLRSLANAHFRQTSFARCCAPANRGAGIAVARYAYVAVDSCIVAYNEGGGIGVYEFQSGCTVICSDVFGNGGGNYVGNLPDQTGIAGNISLDPRFCDLSTGDFQLATDSPCLPQNNNCNILMGALLEGCDLTTSAPENGFDPGPKLPVLKIYPNPMRGELHLSFAPGGQAAACERGLALKIVDPSGRMIFNGELEARALLAGSATLDLREQMRGLAAGVYFGRIEDCQGDPHPFRFTLVK